jgi:hypothetical protein
LVRVLIIAIMGFFPSSGARQDESLPAKETIRANTAVEGPPRLSDLQVKEAVDKEREKNSSLPRPFSQHRWQVRSQGNYYVYTELPFRRGFTRSIYSLNRAGKIVDVLQGITNPSHS